MLPLPRVACSLAIAALLSGAAHAQVVIRVPADAPTIQAGIALAQDGDTVLVAAGTYPEAIDFVGKAITVASADGAEATTIDATNTGSPPVGFFSNEGNGSVLRGFTVTGGNTNGPPGAGISAWQASPRIEACIVRGNRSFISAGAGIGGDPIVEDTLIEDNFTGLGSGGGVFGAPTMRRCVVRGNSSYDAGGLYLLGGSLEECQVVLNFSGEGATAGGVTIAGDGIVLTRCVVSFNISSGFGQYRVKGSGIHVDSGRSTTLVNCTIVGNRVVGSGPFPDENVGGIFGRAVLVNTILGGNDAGEFDSSSNLTATYSDISEAIPGTGNFSADPRFVDFAHRNLHLRAESPCIDAGDPASPPDPDGTRADVGAFAFLQRGLALRSRGAPPRFLEAQR
jgi:hypothetical protein